MTNWHMAAARALDLRDTLPAERWTPNVEVHHQVDELTFALEVPRVCLDELGVMVEDGVLTVRGVCAGTGPFVEVWKLTDDADVGRIAARFDGRRLEVTVPRSASAGPDVGRVVVPVAAAGSFTPPPRA